MPWLATTRRPRQATGAVYAGQNNNAAPRAANGNAICSQAASGRHAPNTTTSTGVACPSGGRSIATGAATTMRSNGVAWWLHSWASRSTYRRIAVWAPAALKASTTNVLTGAPFGWPGARTDPELIFRPVVFVAIELCLGRPTPAALGEVEVHDHEVVLRRRPEVSVALRCVPMEVTVSDRSP